MNRLRLLLTLACFLIGPVAAFAQGKQPKPLDPLSPADNEKYANLLQQHKAAKAKLDNVLQEANKTDPALERAAYWLDHLRLTGNTQFRQLEKQFLSANADKKNDYRRWVRGYSASVANETLDKEWNDVPSARPALLFLAENQLAMAMEREKAGGRKKGGDAQKGAVIIPELKGSDAEKWGQFRTYSSKRSGDFSIDYDVDALERELRVPEDLKRELRKQAADGALGLAYGTYHRAHLPPEATALRKQIVGLVNELSQLRPGWEAAEGIESPTDAPQGGNPTVSQPGRLYLVLAGCAALIVVLSVILVLSRRRRAMKRDITDTWADNQ